MSRAIPSSECVSIGGSLQKYYYQATYEHHYGTRAVPVTASVTYTLTWNDGRTHREQVTVTKSVEVPREYSYWKIRIDQFVLSEKCRGTKRCIARRKHPAGESVLPKCHSAKEYRFHDTPGGSRCGGWRCDRWRNDQTCNSR